MLSRIPSWVAGVTGAVIAIAATITSSTLLHQTRGEIADVGSEIADKRDSVNRLWSNHRRADQQSTAADMFLAQALAPSPGQSFLLERTAYHMMGAVLSMRTASGEPVPDETPETIAEAMELLGKGDAAGYETLRSEIDRLRLLSQSHLNDLANETQSAEARIESLRARESWLYLAYVFFNLLGLMVVMCKDLPVWRAEVHGTWAE